MAAVLGGMLCLTSGCGSSERGVTIPKEEQRDPSLPVPGQLQGKERIEFLIGQLNHEKPNRGIACARQLGRLGAEAEPAIPKLEEYIAMEPDSEGFPSEKQKAVFKEALDQIKAAVANKGGGAAK